VSGRQQYRVTGEREMALLRKGYEVGKNIGLFLKSHYFALRVLDRQPVALPERVFSMW
jgi:hypothetical protein